MAMKDLFALAGTITVDSSGAIKNIDNATKAAQQSESKFSSSFKKIAMAAATYLSATAIWNFGKSMVEAAAEVQATNAQFDAAFKDLSGSAEEAFARVEASSGTLSERLLTTGTKAFSQFTGAGMESADALGKMEEYLNLATDGAAYYDLSLEEVDERLRSFLRGNTEAGDAIGLFTSESQRNAKANEMYGKSFIKLSEDQKQLVMLDITKSIYDASGATGQAAREADGYANVVGNLKEQWKQFLAQVGAPVLQAVIPILQTLGDVLQSLAPIFTTLTTFLVENKELIKAVVIGLLSAVTAIGLVKGAMAAYNGIMAIVNTVTRTYTVVTRAMSIANVQATTTTKVLATAQRLLNKAFLASPLTWIVLGITAVVAAFVLLWNKCEGFRNFWQNMWAQIKNVASQVWAQIKAVWQEFEPYFKALFKAVKEAAQAAWNLIKKIWNAAKPFFKPIFDFIKNAAKTALDNVKLAFSIAWTAVKTTWNNAKAFFKMIFNTITGIFKVIKSVLSGDFKGAWNAIKGIFGGVRTFFNSVVSNITGAFSNIGQKIADKFRGVGAKIKEKFTSIGGKVGGWIKNLVGFSSGGVFTGESAIRVAEYPNATTNPEVVTPQNIMRDTFAETLDNYTLKTSGSNESAAILAILKEYLPTMAQMKMVLSTGELVGALTPRIDKSLGERSEKKARGRV